VAGSSEEFPHAALPMKAAILQKHTTPIAKEEITAFAVF
jgi:hypothetical protein